MFCKDVREKVPKLVESETAHAYTEHGKINSPHEGYAVLKEEKEELDIDILDLKYALESFWLTIKRDQTEELIYPLRRMKAKAESAAMEAIQVAAVAQRVLDILE